MQNKDGWTALNFAAYYGKASTVKLLVENHADVNKPNKAGRTSLSCATQYNYPEIEPQLQTHGAKSGEKL